MDRSWTGSFVVTATEYYKLTDENTQGLGPQLAKGFSGQIEYMSASQLSRLIVRRDGWHDSNAYAWL